jgi:methyl-accepting chemotaxis protein
MFPQSFSARVAQRMAIWGGALGLLLCLYLATEFISAWHSGEIAAQRQQAVESLVLQVTSNPAASMTPERATGYIKTLIGKIEAIQAINAEQVNQWSVHRRNKILLMLLMLFVIGEILIIEYRLLISPIMRVVAVLQNGKGAIAKLAPYARRHDEIGAFAQALTSHFALVGMQQELASAEQAKLTERLRAQEEFRRDSLAFQAHIADIVRHLEGHAGRMSTASENLATISSTADEQAGASVAATQRVTSNVDVVASSIREIAMTLAAAAEGAEKTCAVAAAARSAVEAAEDDSQALSEAAHTIEQVIALIEDVAGQTNLLALNATIEAARAGEMGRGFGVVAHEVKQLATRTARATEDVRGGLQGITAASLRIAERVAKLVESIDQVAAVASGIAQSIREQDASSQSITSTTAKTADDVRDVAESIKDVAGAIGEAKQAAELVTKVSTDLGQQASSLRAAVERFIETTERIAA